jgi:hypothetical protein
MRSSDIDWENVAEEIESLGRSDKHQIDKRLARILEHLLKWEFQPEQRSASWEATLREQRIRLNRLLQDSPSLGTYPATALGGEYEIALLRAAAATGLPKNRFPAENPYRIADVLDPDFLPESAAPGEPA